MLAPRLEYTRSTPEASGLLRYARCAAISASLHGALREWHAELPAILAHARAAPPLYVPATPRVGGGAASPAEGGGEPGELGEAQRAVQLAALAWGQLVHALCCCELTPLLRLMRHRHRAIEWEHVLSRQCVLRRHAFAARPSYSLAPMLAATPELAAHARAVASQHRSSSPSAPSTPSTRSAPPSPSISSAASAPSAASASSAPFAPSAASACSAGAGDASSEPTEPPLTEPPPPPRPAARVPPYSQALAQTLPQRFTPPVLYEDSYYPHPELAAGAGGAAQAAQGQPPPPADVYTDLVVLVHGYSGSAYDVRLLRSYLQLQLPRAAFLLSCANEQLVNEPIEKMAERLAQEVEGFIAGNGRRLRLQRLSFVAFSIGALVLRAALRLPSLRRHAPMHPCTYAHVHMHVHVHVRAGSTTRCILYP